MWMPPLSTVWTPKRCRGDDAFGRPPPAALESRLAPRPAAIVARRYHRRTSGRSGVQAYNRGHTHRSHREVTTMSIARCAASFTCAVLLFAVGGAARAEDSAKKTGTPPAETAATPAPQADTAATPAEPIPAAPAT